MIVIVDESSVGEGGEMIDHRYMIRECSKR